MGRYKIDPKEKVTPVIVYPKVKQVEQYGGKKEMQNKIMEFLNSNEKP